MNEFKPCPFCGSTNLTCVNFEPEHMHLNKWIECDDCGGSNSGSFDKNKAIEMWNTRVVG